VNDAVRVACAQVEPVVFDRAGTLEKLAATAADAAAHAAQLVLFPETFVPAYPSSRWVRALAAGGDKEVWARLARSSVTVPSADTDAMGAVAKQHGIVLAVGVNELDGATLYNALLVFAPDGELVLRHRKLMPTNHERMVWGLGDGSGLETIETALGRVGGIVLVRARDAETASTASPTNFSVVPPKRSACAFTSSNSSPCRSRTSSGSSFSPSAVDPVRSAKRIVTTRRSCRSSLLVARRASSRSA
jgi:Carbon-nitrogen hydrolase